MSYTAKESVTLISTAVDALRDLKAQVKTATDALVPLVESNATLQDVVDGLVAADAAVDAKLSELASELSAPAPVVDPV